MKKVYRDDPAFPCGGTYPANGLTKREWFAGLAMQGFIAGNYTVDSHIKLTADDCRSGMATAAVKLADSLISVLEVGDAID